MYTDLEELTGKVRKTNRRLAGLQLQARQPRLATKPDVKQGLKTRARKEDVAVDEKFEDISSARVDDDQMGWTSFGNSAEPSALEKIYGFTRSGRRRRRSVKAASLTRGDTHVNTRWWLTARRLNFYNVEEHLSPTASFLKFM